MMKMVTHSAKRGVTALRIGILVNIPALDTMFRMVRFLGMTTPECILGIILGGVRQEFSLRSGWTTPTRAIDGVESSITTLSRIAQMRVISPPTGGLNGVLLVGKRTETSWFGLSNSEVKADSR
jgi:hypothetical protein